MAENAFWILSSDIGGLGELNRLNEIWANEIVTEKAIRQIIRILVIYFTDNAFRILSSDISGLGELKRLN